MLISEFAIATGLSVDTVRFYVAKGHLQPDRNLKGGSNSYHHFKPKDVATARMIRLQQTLGYTLNEILALNDEYRAGEHSAERTIEILQSQIDRLQQRKGALEAALTFLDRKVAWIRSGKAGPAPQL